MHNKINYKNLVWRSVLFWAVVAIYVFLVELLVFIGFKNMNAVETLSSKQFWVIGFSITAVLIAGYYSIKGVYGYMKSFNDEVKEKPFWYESWQLKRFGFKITDYAKLGASSVGHVIGVEDGPKGKSAIVSNAKATAVLGCLESATAKAHIGFNLNKWQADNSNPTVFIFDTNKEILNNYNAGFEQAGFEMLEVDLDEPKYIQCWNPFASILEKVEPIKELTNGLENKDGKYQGAGETFQTYKAARERLQVLQSELVWHIQSVLDSIFPKYDGDEAEEDAKTLILGIMIAFTEDYVSGKMSAEEFTLYSLMTTLRKGAENPEELRKYLISKRTKYSLAKMTVKDVFGDVKALKWAIDTVRIYLQDLDDENLLLSVSGKDVFKSATKTRVVFIKLSTKTRFKERLSLLFLKQVCFKEKTDGNVKFLVKDNLALTFYEPFFTALKDKKIEAIVELNNLKPLQEKYGDAVADISTWFGEKIWFHGNGKETEYIELCKDNVVTQKGKEQTSIPIIQSRVLEKAKEEDVVVTSINGMKPVFTTFVLYDYGDESEPNLIRIQLEKAMESVYDIALFQRDF